ncbi:protein-disulfide reductase DsbD domain-containing protein [Marinigracilibium pacificum]|uniref:Thiol:disulfide interchange protein DsbD N-terminal domain-containing protein n=1 Tax=Marinigracilibium pacificum TaxID=2729599 RepID=A0A848IW64_9BACT|nr:protein-disulfide reductase DsbD domain-containing protein [Marinigracilibium pacificum]NMM48577.1 hypothetical protein [Marinigracilibium pacificum]
MSYYKRISIILIILTHSLSFSQDTDWVTFNGYKTNSDHKPDTIYLEFQIEQGYHIQSNDPGDDMVIPTKIKLDSIDGLIFGEPVFPGSKTFYISEIKTKVFEDVFEVKIPLIYKNRPKSYFIKGTLFYQPCDNKKCYFPRELSFSVYLNN